MHKSLNAFWHLRSPTLSAEMDVFFVNGRLNRRGNSRVGGDFFDITFTIN